MLEITNKLSFSTENRMFFCARFVPWVKIKQLYVCGSVWKGKNTLNIIYYGNRSHVRNDSIHTYTSTQTLIKAHTRSQQKQEPEAKKIHFCRICIHNVSHCLTHQHMSILGFMFKKIHKQNLFFNRMPQVNELPRGCL